MKNTILAVVVALALGAMFLGYASISVAGPNDVYSNYVDAQPDVH